MLGATLNYRYDEQREEFQETIQALRENTYLDNMIKTEEKEVELEEFKRQASSILESGKFFVLKWESDVERLESEGSTNPSKILRTVWNKGADLLEVQVPEPRVNQPLKKRGLLSHLTRIYYPPWIMSPKTVKGKQIYRYAYHEIKG